METFFFFFPNIIVKYCLIIHLKLEEVKEAMHNMRKGRANRPNGIPMGFWKTPDKTVMEWLIGWFNVIFGTINARKWKWSTNDPLVQEQG